MDMETLTMQILETLLSPPGLILVLFLMGSLLTYRFYTFSKILSISGFLLLLIASLPVIAQFNMGLIETAPHLTEQAIKGNKAQAIIVLGAGRATTQSEYKRDTVSIITLQRLRYAAYLHKKTQLPILVTGGSTHHDKKSYAALMKKTLEQEFGVKVRWVEPQARNTSENAQFSLNILNREKIKSAYIVTHAWHMTRAYQAFANNKLEIIPAPTAYTSITKDRSMLLNWLPDADALQLHKIFIQEMLRRLRHKLSD